MIRILVLIILLFTNLSAQSQDIEFKNDARELAELNFDKTYFDKIKNITLYKSSTRERENFERDYAVVVNSFYSKIVDFYIIKYTHQEIKEILGFYKTSYGKKLLNDIKLINSNNFPEKKEFGDQLDSIKF